MIAVTIDSESTSIATEQLWTKRIDDQRYQLCCIPFFAYDLALGDIVEADGSYLVTKVVQPSGRYVFRVHLPDPTPDLADEIVLHLAERGALVEWSSQSLFSVDAPDQEHAQSVADYLATEEERGRLIYETGRTR